MPADVVTVTVVNEATVPISVTSHFHFLEANPRLRFDRAAAYGRHLQVPAGDHVRFDPGVPTTVALRPIGGARTVVGFSGLVDGPLDASGMRQRALDRLRTAATWTAGRPAPREPGRGAGGRRRPAGRAAAPGAGAVTLDRRSRADVYGPGRGDRVWLGDTGLSVVVERDDRDGDELLMGFGKTGRDGIAMRAVRTTESCDVVISNVLLIDPLLGVRTTSIGIRQGRVVAVGKAGNPDTSDGIDVVVGSGTAIVSGEGLIATPGGVDTHVHLLSPRVCEAELAGGVTTVVGQEIGPFWGVGVGSAWLLRHGYGAFDDYPLNVGLLGRGSSSRRDPLLEALEAGVCGFKVHEDTGAHLRTLDTALDVAEEYDVQVAIHTDGLNEGLSVADTVAALDGRTVHAYHVEGCGGGHVPDVLTLAGVPHVLASSTNPTLPFGRDAVAEHRAMIPVVHGLRAGLMGDLALVEDRVRAATMGAENLLHDLGVIPITSSDAQGMGRAGETWRRTFAMAGILAARSRHDVRSHFDVRSHHEGTPVTAGRSGGSPGRRDDPAPSPDHHQDNDRVLRYVAKITINPAIAHGLSHEVGTLAPGHLADIVLWDPASFAAKPRLVLKAGFPAWGVTGDPNASIDDAEPLVIDRQFGGHGAAAADLSVLFVNGAAASTGLGGHNSRRRPVAVHGCRGLTITDMVAHSHAGPITVRTADTGADGRGADSPVDVVVTLAGRPLHLDPADEVPLSRLYFL